MTVTVLPVAERPALARQIPVSMIERMTLILDAFDAATPTLTLLEIVERTGLPRSTVHRILDQMIRLRWLAHTSGGYRLGMRTLELGGLTADHNEIRDTVGPLLHELAQRTGMVGHLAVLDGREVVYLDKVGGRFAAALPTRLGGRMPAHATALGKAMLAALEPTIAEAAFRTRMRRLTPPHLLRARSAAARTRPDPAAPGRGDRPRGSDARNRLRRSAITRSRRGYRSAVAFGPGRCDELRPAVPGRAGGRPRGRAHAVSAPRAVAVDHIGICLSDIVR